MENTHNDYSKRKSHYAEPATYSFGISFSKKIPPSHYGSQFSYYLVNLSVQHNFLLVDIVESPRNQGKLSAYHINLQEVNSLDNIPPEAVQTYISTSKSHCIFQKSEKIANENFFEGCGD